MSLYPKLEVLAEKTSNICRPKWEEIEVLTKKNEQKILEAFQATKVSSYHFLGSTGYGYADTGRETLDCLFARIVGAEKALVRQSIASGTVAIVNCLFGLLRPGDDLLILGDPYDTLKQVLAGPQVSGSLQEWKIGCRIVPWEAEADEKTLSSLIQNNTRVLALQRSRGYSWKESLSLSSMGRIIAAAKGIKPELIVFVDNCYGEFVEREEPLSVGADLMAGSLIKNPGGGLALSGGYVAGKKTYVNLVANRLTAPGIGEGIGASPYGYLNSFQGLFLAPRAVGESLKGMVWAAAFLEQLGLEVSPRYDTFRTDIVQAVRLGSREALVEFCRGLQQGSPVDSHITPEPLLMPGYNDEIIMAGGTFIQGSTIELSADGPLRPPYIAYLQGGLSQHYVHFAVLAAVKRLIEGGFLELP